MLIRNQQVLGSSPSARVVIDLLGHSEIRVTMDLYSHVAPVMQREAADQMEALLATASPRQK
jgi:integrase